MLPSRSRSSPRGSARRLGGRDERAAAPGEIEALRVAACSDAGVARALIVLPAPIADDPYETFLWLAEAARPVGRLLPPLALRLLDENPGHGVVRWIDQGPELRRQLDQMAALARSLGDSYPGRARRG